MAGCCEWLILVGRTCELFSVQLLFASRGALLYACFLIIRGGRALLSVERAVYIQ